MRSFSISTGAIDFDENETVFMKYTFFTYLFKVVDGTVSTVFLNTAYVMCVCLMPSLVKWPRIQDLMLTLPYSLRQKFQKCACIIDCFEIFIERHEDLVARAQTYSTYKSHNTMKYLI